MTDFSTTQDDLDTLTEYFKQYQKLFGVGEYQVTVCHDGDEDRDQSIPYGEKIQISGVSYLGDTNLDLVLARSWREEPTEALLNDVALRATLLLILREMYVLYVEDTRDRYDDIKTGRMERAMHKAVNRIMAQLPVPSA